MPVLYFDTLKTSSLEGAATTVYAQGGKGNPRLVAWEGDRTVTFTMEDACAKARKFLEPVADFEPMSCKWNGE